MALVLTADVKYSAVFVAISSIMLYISMPAEGVGAALAAANAAAKTRRVASLPFMVVKNMVGFLEAVWIGRA